MGSLLFFPFIIVLYFLPSIIGKKNEHPQVGAIFLLNFLLGWTLLGWVASLVWVFVRPKEEAIYFHNEQTPLSNNVQIHNNPLSPESESQKWEMAKEYNKVISDALKEVFANTSKRSHKRAENYLKDVYLNLGEHQIDGHVIETIITKIIDEEVERADISQRALAKLKKEVELKDAELKEAEFKEAEINEAEINEAGHVIETIITKIIDEEVERADISQRALAKLKKEAELKEAELQKHLTTLPKETRSSRRRHRR